MRIMQDFGGFSRACASCTVHDRWPHRSSCRRSACGAAALLPKLADHGAQSWRLLQPPSFYGGDLLASISIFRQVEDFEARDRQIR